MCRRSASTRIKAGAAASIISRAGCRRSPPTALRTRWYASRWPRSSPVMAESDPAKRYRANLQGEVDSAGLYRALADTEGDPKVSEVYRRLSAVEEAHAEFWAGQLARMGGKAGATRPDWRTRALAWLARRFGPQFVLPTLSTLEQRDIGTYDSQPEAVAGGLPSAERSHNRVVQALASSFPAGAPGSTLAQAERPHPSGG